MKENTCKFCGCTETDCSRCIIKDGHSCWWLDDEMTVCSSCKQEYIEELIKSIHVDRSNFEYIAKTGKINGSLYIDLKNLLNKLI